jgi:hypothetical protein
MTDFDTLQNRLWADVLDRLGGVDAIFSTGDRPVAPIKVLLTESMQLQPSGRTQTWLQVSTIEYSLADMAHVAKVGETFTIDGIRYTVQSIMNNDGYIIKVGVSE